MRGAGAPGWSDDDECVGSTHAARRLHQAGVRGVRYMIIPGAGGPLAWDSIEAMAARLPPLGWHINLQRDGRELPARF